MAIEDYPILIDQTADGGFGAWCPDLLGCVALGRTIDETVSEMREAMAFHIEGIEADGDLVPPPSGSGVYVGVTTALTLTAARST